MRESPLERPLDCPAAPITPPRRRVTLRAYTAAGRGITQRQPRWTASASRWWVGAAAARRRSRGLGYLAVLPRAERSSMNKRVLVSLREYAR